MEYIAIPKGTITVSRIGVGSWQVSGWVSSDRKKFERVVKTALEVGITFFDTAEAYGNGYSEEVLGECLAATRSSVVIATKFGHTNSSPTGIRKSLEHSLRRLKTDYIDIFQQHWPPPSISLQQTIDELLLLKEEGKIKAVGVSNWMEPEWTEIRNPNSIDSLQPCYSLLWRGIEPRVLPMCIREGIAVFPYSPLCQGLLTGRFRSRSQAPEDSRSKNVLFSQENFPIVQRTLEILDALSTKYQKSHSAIALRWLLDTPGVTAPIVGASSAEQLSDSLRCLGWKLENSDYNLLAEATRSLPQKPGPHDSLWNWHPRKTTREKGR